MKAALLAALTAAASLACVGCAVPWQGGGSATKRPPSPSPVPEGRQDCYEASLVSPSFGYAACGHSLLVTADGRSWRRIARVPRDFWIHDVVFLDKRTGWLVANDCAMARAFVARTLDGGRTWIRARVQSTGCSAGSRLELSILDSLRGLLANNDLHVDRAYASTTDDGGATWSPEMALPMVGSPALAATDIGWLAKGDLARPGARNLFWTRNGGHSWSARELPRRRGWIRALFYPDVPRFFGCRGVLPVDVSRKRSGALAFYTTEDCGATWRLATAQPLPKAPTTRGSTFVDYAPTNVASPETWWLLSGRSIRVTDDAGRHWIVRRPRGLPELQWPKISAADGRQAWILHRAQRGDGTASLYATRDGGRTWQPLDPRDRGG